MHHLSGDSCTRETKASRFCILRQMIEYPPHTLDVPDDDDFNSAPLSYFKLPIVVLDRYLLCH